jgi:hypothetical protein
MAQSEGGRRLIGRIEGVQIDIRDIMDRQGVRVTRIAVDLPPGLPRATQMLHLDSAPLASATAYDADDAPSLSATSPSQAFLDRVLAHEGVLEAVNAVVVDYPSSVITDDRIIMLVPGRPVGLAGPVRRVIQARNALQAGCRANLEARAAS